MIVGSAFVRCLLEAADTGQPTTAPDAITALTKTAAAVRRRGTTPDHG